MCTPLACAGIIILPGVTGSEPNQFASIFGDIGECRLCYSPPMVATASAVLPSGVLLSSIGGMIRSSHLSHLAESLRAMVMARQDSRLHKSAMLLFL